MFPFLIFSLADMCMECVLSEVEMTFKNAPPSSSPAWNPMKIKASLLFCINISLIRYNAGTLILSVSRHLHTSDSHGGSSGIEHCSDTISFEADSTLVMLQANILFSCFPLQRSSVIGTDWTINLNFPVPSGESFNLLASLYSPVLPLHYKSFLNKHTS